MSISILSNDSPLTAVRSLRLPNLKSSPALSNDMPAQRISSQLLLKGARELVIQHQGGEYHLRLTRNDKLILTK